MNLMNGHFKYAKNPRLAPIPLTIISINSKDRFGIKCWRLSNPIPVSNPNRMKFFQICGFLTET